MALNLIAFLALTSNAGMPECTTLHNLPALMVHPRVALVPQVDAARGHDLAGGSVVGQGRDLLHDLDGVLGRGGGRDLEQDRVLVAQGRDRVVVMERELGLVHLRGARPARAAPEHRSEIESGSRARSCAVISTRPGPRPRPSRRPRREHESIGYEAITMDTTANAFKNESVIAAATCIGCYNGITILPTKYSKAEAREMPKYLFLLTIMEVFR